MNAGRLNKAGMECFREYVVHARNLNRRGIAVPPVPPGCVAPGEMCEACPMVLPRDPGSFPTKLAIGEHFGSVMDLQKFEEMRSDVGFWTWCAAYYFDLITNNRTKIKEPRAYIAALTYQEFYRHLILGPCHIYFMAKDDPGRVRVLLYDEPTTMNEVLVQFGSYQTLMQNQALQAVIQRLYYDPKRGRIKTGAGGKEAGSPRRLMDFLRQIELNYDLLSVQSDRFWSMLPAEFDRFKRV